MPCCKSQCAFFAAVCDDLAICRWTPVRLTSKVRIPLGEEIARVGGDAEWEDDSLADLGVEVPDIAVNEPVWLDPAC